MGASRLPGSLASGSGPRRARRVCCKEREKRRRGRFGSRSNRCATIAPAMPDLLQSIDRDRLAQLCDRHGIAKLALFGSAARGQLRPESDLDILVEFAPGRRVGLRFITVQEELQALLGRPVDLNTRAFLSPHFRDRVEAEAVPLYEAA